MRQDLFVIPREIAGIEVFGFGWLLGLWIIVLIVMLAWSFRRHGWSAATRSLLQISAVVALFIALVVPLLVEPRGLPIRGYGMMFLLAVVAGVSLSMFRARRFGVDPELILSLTTWLVVSGIVGARLFYIVEYWDKFQKPTLIESLKAMVNITQGGLVVYGSMLAGGAALIVFVHKHKLPGLALADLIAPGVVLGAGLGRLGCFLNGCCYGGITDLPWAVQFPPGSPAYVDQAQRGDLYLHGLIFAGSLADPAIIKAVETDSQAALSGLMAGQRVVEINDHAIGNVGEAQWELMNTFGDATTVTVRTADESPPKRWTITAAPLLSRPVHPTQLYSLFDAVLLCVFILAYEPYKRRDGELTALVLTIHPISRFFLEIIRVDESPVFHTSMSISQNISIAIFAGGVFLWIYLFARRPLGSVLPMRGGTWAVAGGRK